MTALRLFTRKRASGVLAWFVKVVRLFRRGFYSLPALVGSSGSFCVILEVINRTVNLR